MTESVGPPSRVRYRVDRVDAGIPWHLQSFGPSVTLPVRSATVPMWHPIVFKVPAGKFFIPDKLLLEGTGTVDVTAQISRRFLLAGNCATANPGAPSAPTVAVVTHDAGNTDANGTNTFDYKITSINALGQETVASAASSTLTPTSAQRAIDVTIPALATGAVAYGVYRRMNAGNWEYIVETQGSITWRDTRPQSDVDTSRTAPGSATWGNAFTGEVASGPCQLIYACLNALSVAPARLVYTDDSGKRDNVAFAPSTSAGTFLRVPLFRQEDAAIWASPATVAAFQTQDARTTDYGATAVHGFNNTYANMGGQWVIWGMQPHIAIMTTAAKFAGSRYSNPLERRVPFPSGSTMVVEISYTTGETASSAINNIELFGRLYDNPI